MQQACDCLAEMLRNDRAPSLDLLLRLAPTELPELPEWAARFNERAKTRRRRRQFQGPIAGYPTREAAKYKSPPADAPLAAWIRAILLTALAHRARDAEAWVNGWNVPCPGPFPEWVRDYIAIEDWPFHFGGRWSEAMQVLRLSCGLSRFPSTRPACGLPHLPSTGRAP